MAAIALIDRNANDVAGQQIAGELDTLELQAKQTRQQMRQGGLAHAWQILDQQMAARQQTAQRQTQLRRLAKNDLCRPL